MELSMIIFGKGGFGVHTLGAIICRAIMAENPSCYVALAPEYDTAVRGGVSNCHLVVSDMPCNPVVEWKPDVGIDICASWATLRTREETWYLSIPSEANRHMLENARGYVLLGMLVARTYVPLSKEAVCAAIESECKAPRMRLMNQNAFEKGLGL
ncbi:MAG: 2-oxoacid:acceptor oxidoreductase family protein [Parcubacteria group bacterium]|nr:2-oxoacid:acceptor oxidoreductase family protein [Parcubacteria group bacterium]